MRLHARLVAFVSGLGVLLSTVGATGGSTQESHIGSLTGHAAAGKKLYRRYCIGCHGPDGDGAGENAQWIDPKPRDFTLAVFKCRSTPTGTLPTDEDLFNAMTRGFVTTNMPQWLPLTGQNRADLVAYIKTFSPKWKTLKPGAPITVPPEPALTGGSCTRKWSAGSVTVPGGMRMAPPPRRSPTTRISRSGRTISPPARASCAARPTEICTRSS